MGNFGETLRREREMRDISLREIADATKINLRYLEALEQNRFDILPGGLFNKGFIRAYARFIGANGEAFVDSYLQEIAAREAAPAGAPGAGGGSTTPGLLRPGEAPRRRADPASPQPSPTPLEQRATHTPSIRFAESATAGAAVRVRPPRPVVAEPSGPPATRAGARPLVVILSLVGIAGVLFVGLMLLRTLRQPPAVAPPEGTATAQPAVASPAASAPADTTADVMPAEGPASPGNDLTPSPADLTGLPAGPAWTDPLRMDAAPATGGNTGPPASPAPATALAPAGASAPAGPFTSTGPSTSTGAPASSRAPADAAGVRDNRGATAVPGGAAAVPRTADAPPIRIASPLSPPPPGIVVAGPAGAAAPGVMHFRLEATAPVWAQVACDGDDLLNRTMQAGETANFRCLSFVRVSVTDIGAVRMLVNGARCAAPGERGMRVEGFVIRLEDAPSICPRPSGADHGRR